MRTIALALALTCMTALTAAQDVWPLLERSADNTTRSRIIHDLPGMRVGFEEVDAKLRAASRPSIKAALILALGGYRDVASDAREAAMSALVRWYEDDVDAGVHGAIAWLMGLWNG